jgi:hypothetical protein
MLENFLLYQTHVLDFFGFFFLIFPLLAGDQNGSVVGGRQQAPQLRGGAMKEKRAGP